MHLIFETPSRNCPLRFLNGRRVLAIDPIGHRHVKRIGSTMPVYRLKIEGDGAWIGPALADEIQIVPDTPLPYTQQVRSTVAA